MYSTSFVTPKKVKGRSNLQSMVPLTENYAVARSQSSVNASITKGCDVAKSCRKSSNFTYSPSTNNADRFISNRSAIDFEYCFRRLVQDENLPLNAPIADTNNKTEAQSPYIHKYNSEISLLSNATPGKRLINCFDSAPSQPPSNKRKRLCLKVITSKMS